MLVSTPKDSWNCSSADVAESQSCTSRRKLEYTHIWNQIDLLCNSSANIQNSFQTVFGESSQKTYGDIARTSFEADMNSVIDQLEKVCRLLKEDNAAQHCLSQVLYESSVAAHNETDVNHFSELSFNESFDNIDTSRTELGALDTSLNDSLLIEERLNPPKKRKISFSCENLNAIPSVTPTRESAPVKLGVRFTTPQPSIARTSPDRPMSIARMALSEARKRESKPTSLSDFTVIKPISKGAYGKVYLAKRRSTAQHYAIKIMKKDDLIRKNMVDQVVTERDALALAQSPFIVRLFYSFQSKYEVYFVMEYLIGGDLCSFLSYVGCLEEEHAILYTVEIALAISYLHKHSIIHKDIKPENMLLDRAGHLKLTDFGLSSIRLHRKLTVNDIVHCTPYSGYSPSQHWRTPGQIASLTSNIAFRDLPIKEASFQHTACVTESVSKDTVGGEANASKDEACKGSSTNDHTSKHSFVGPVFTTPITKKKRFIPKRCSFSNVSNASLEVLKTPNTVPLNDSKPLLLNLCKTPDPAPLSPVPQHHEPASASILDSSLVSRYSDEDISFGEPASPSDEQTTSPSDVLQSVSKVIGTPDYIAPEVLLHRPHTEAADWWSLGVCLYEMVSGIPPFHDGNITDIFKNILNLDIEWPEDISEGAKDVVLKLLEPNPASRASIVELKELEFFKGVDWENVLSTEMPFVPQPENETDTGYFDGHNSAFNIKLSDFDGCAMQKDCK